MKKFFSFKKRRWAMLLFVAGIVFYNLDPYGIEKDYSFLVLDKMQAEQHRSSARFILVLKDTVNQEVFSFDMEPASYSQARVGSYVTMHISEHVRSGRSIKTGLIGFIIPISLWAYGFWLLFVASLEYEHAAEIALKESKKKQNNF